VKRCALALLLVIAGCTPFESSRQLNSQNKQIGAKLKQHSDAEVAQMGADVEANSQALETYEDLKPEGPVQPYTADASAKLRAQLKTDFESPWYRKLWVWITAGTGATIIGYLLMLLHGASKANPITALAGDGLAALLDLFHAAGKDASPAGLVTKESLAKIIGDLRADEKYGHLVDDLLAKYHMDTMFPKTEPIT
jgi:hypothetical protein